MGINDLRYKYLVPRDTNTARTDTWTMLATTGNTDGSTSTILSMQPVMPRYVALNKANTSYNKLYLRTFGEASTLTANATLAVLAGRDDAETRAIQTQQALSALALDNMSRNDSSYLSEMSLAKLDRTEMPAGLAHLLDGLHRSQRLKLNRIIIDALRTNDSTIHDMLLDLRERADMNTFASSIIGSLKFGETIGKREIDEAREAVRLTEDMLSEGNCSRLRLHDIWHQLDEDSRESVRAGIYRFIDLQSRFAGFVENIDSWCLNGSLVYKYLLRIAIITANLGLLAFKAYVSTMARDPAINQHFKSGSSWDKNSISWLFYNIACDTDCDNRDAGSSQVMTHAIDGWCRILARCSVNLSCTRRECLRIASLKFDTRFGEPRSFPWPIMSAIYAGLTKDMASDDLFAVGNCARNAMSALLNKNGSPASIWRSQALAAIRQESVYPCVPGVETWDESGIFEGVLCTSSRSRDARCAISVGMNEPMFFAYADAQYDYDLNPSVCGDALFPPFESVQNDAICRMFSREYDALYYHLYGYSAQVSASAVIYWADSAAIEYFKSYRIVGSPGRLSDTKPKTTKFDRPEWMYRIMQKYLEIVGHLNVADNESIAQSFDQASRNGSLAAYAKDMFEFVYKQLFEHCGLGEPIPFLAGGGCVETMSAIQREIDDAIASSVDTSRADETEMRSLAMCELMR